MSCGTLAPGKPDLELAVVAGQWGKRNRNTLFEVSDIHAPLRAS